jgi:hypothetical protein
LIVMLGIASCVLLSACGSGSNPTAPSPAFIPTTATSLVIIRGQVWCGSSKNGQPLNCQGQPIP